MILSVSRKVEGKGTADHGNDSQIIFNQTAVG